MKPEPRAFFRLMFIALALCLLGAAQSAMALLDYQEPEQTSSVKAVLYFRYINSAYLGQEERSIQVRHTQSLEQALVEALLKGPRDQDAFPHPLFPEGTSLINVLAEGSRLFVTFSREVQDPLPGENASAGREAARLRRRLAMASLVNTLTEAGQFQSVQVLILDAPGISNSMRLSNRFYLEDGDALPPPLTRQEEAVISPGQAATAIAQRWKSQDWQALGRLLLLRDAAGSMPAVPFNSAAMPLLTAWSATDGTIAPDGRSAVILVDLSLQPEAGEQVNLTVFPLIMLQEGQGWRISAQSLRHLLDQVP